MTRRDRPGVYVLRRAPAGRYAVRAHDDVSVRDRASAREKVYVTRFACRGTPAEGAIENVVTIGDEKSWHDLATLVAR